MRAGPIVLSLLMLSFAGCHCRPPDPDGPAEWDRVNVRVAAGTPELHDIAGTSPTDVWAVGEVRSAASPLPLGCVLHFDGQLWTESPLPAGTRALAAVAVVSRTDVRVATVDARVLRFDGTTWTPETLPADAANASVTSFGVVPGGAEIWATLNRPGRVMRWQAASGWTSVAVTSLASMTPPAIWASSATDVWIPAARAPRFDGQTWSIANVGLGALRGVSGTGPSDIWMFGGRGGNMSVFSGAAAGFHYDGRAWTEATMPPDTLYMRDVCSASPTEAVVVGVHGHAMRWNGTAWRRSRTGFEARQPAPFPNLDAVVCWPGHAFAVGVIGPVILRLRSGT